MRSLKIETAQESYTVFPPPERLTDVSLRLSERVSVLLQILDIQ